MKKAIRDLFTEEEWETLAEELLPKLGEIAELPLLDKEDIGNDSE